MGENEEVGSTEDEGEEKVLIERPGWPSVVQYFVTGLPRIDADRDGYRMCYKSSIRACLCRERMKTLHYVTMSR
jgi:hypothetical protein